MDREHRVVGAVAGTPLVLVGQLCGLGAAVNMPTDDSSDFQIFGGNIRAAVEFGVAWIVLTVAGLAIAARVSRRPRPILATAIATAVYALFAAFAVLSWPGLIVFGIICGLAVAVLFEPRSVPNGHQV